jgi:hypothetical protein
VGKKLGIGMELVATSERGEAAEVSCGVDSQSVTVSVRRRRLRARTARRPAGRREGERSRTRASRRREEGGAEAVEGELIAVA